MCHNSNRMYNNTTEMKQAIKKMDDYHRTDLHHVSNKTFPFIFE